MKKISNYRGFTLVELLVVVAIIAILSVIGLTIFTSAQSNARDARRKSDVDAIANALETNKPVASIYYKSPSDGSWFSGGSIPADSTTAKYCIKTYTTDDGAKNDPFIATGTTGAWAWVNTSACPTTPSDFKEAKTGAGNGFDTTAGTGVFRDDYVKAWQVCARLEAGTTLQVYCKPSSQ